MESSTTPPPCCFVSHMSSASTGYDSALSPVVLLDLFSSLAQCDFTKATRVVVANMKKEKDLKKTSIAFMNNQLLGVLNQLVTACNMHASLLFLEYKWFRKNTLSLTYASILEDIVKIEAQLREGVLKSDEETRLYMAVCQSCASFVRSRQGLMNAYMSFSTIAVPTTTAAYLEVVHALRAIQDRFKDAAHHPLFRSLRLGHEVEVSIFLALLLAQVEATEYRFKDAAVLLLRCKVEFERWRRLMMSIAVDSSFEIPPSPREQSANLISGIVASGEQSAGSSFSAPNEDDGRDRERLSELGPSNSGAAGANTSATAASTNTSSDGAGGAPQSRLAGQHTEGLGGVGSAIPPLTLEAVTSLGSIQPPMTYKWLLYFHSSLVSKFTLYFSNILKKNTALDFKVLSGRLETDYFTLIKNFHRKSNAVNVSLVLCAEGLTFHPEGYTHPSEPYEPLTGMQSFPSIYSFPTPERPMEHWPNVVSIISDNFPLLASMRKSVYLFDSKILSTYFLTLVDPNVVAVVIFNQKKQENDQAVNDFFQTLTLGLRNTKVLQALKPAN